MQDYIFHVHHEDRVEPDVLAVAVRDHARAEQLARERLGLNERHEAVEVWQGQQRLFRVSRDGGGY